MKKITAVDIETDESGEYCSLLCPHIVGEWCDAFIVALKMIAGTRFRIRCEECKRREIKKCIAD